MPSPSRKTLASLILPAILALLVIACGGGEDEDAPYRIGVMESLTGAGETYGTVALQSKQMALDEINAADGINGRMLEFVVEDSKCGAMLRVAPLAEKDGVVLFSGLVSSPDIANAL